MILTAIVGWLPGFSLISRISSLLVDVMAMDVIRMEREMVWEECCGREAVQWEQATLLVGIRSSYETTGFQSRRSRSAQNRRRCYMP